MTKNVRKPKFQPKIILTVGISGSGKTRWAEAFVAKNPLFVNINRDDCRVYAHCGMDEDAYNSYRFSDSKEDIVTDICMIQVNHALSVGKGVVISDTNLNPAIRDFWKRVAEDKGVPYEEISFDLTLHECIRNNRRRHRTLPDKLLRDQYLRFRLYKGMPTYIPDETKPNAIICDLDGTLFHMTERKPFEFERVDEDYVDTTVLNILKDHIARGYKILIFTGREDIGTCREKTLAMLKEHGVEFAEFDMRPFKCHDSDVLVKERMLWKIADQYNIEFAIDDRDQVVGLWRSLGIKCLQVEYGDF